jgi:hypothetical protein
MKMQVEMCAKTRKSFKYDKPIGQESTLLIKIYSDDENCNASRNTATAST